MWYVLCIQLLDNTILVERTLTTNKYNSRITRADSDEFYTAAILTDITSFIGKDLNEMRDILWEDGFKNHFRSGGKYYGKKLIYLRRTEYRGNIDPAIFAKSMTSNGWTNNIETSTVCTDKDFYSSDYTLKTDWECTTTFTKDADATPIINKGEMYAF